jgi:DNA-binding transcriptional ArsR family regulator
MASYLDGAVSEAGFTPDPALVGELIGAMVHPVRGKIIAALTDKPGLGAKDIAERLGEPIGKVRYHLRALVEADLIVVEEEPARRGVVEHRYRSRVTPALPTEVYLSDDQTRAIALEVFRILFDDVTRSAQAGALWRRDDRWLARLWAEVDARGWKELGEIHERALEETRRVVEESSERLRAGEEEPIPVTSGFLMFEAPIWAPPAD